MTATMPLSATKQITQATQAAYTFINFYIATVTESARMTRTVKYDHWVYTTTIESEVGGNWHEVQVRSPDPHSTGKLHLYKVDDLYYCQRDNEWQQGNHCLNPDGDVFFAIAFMLLGIMPDTTDINGTGMATDAISIQAVQSISQTVEEGTHFTVYHYTSHSESYNTLGEITLWMRQSDGRPFRARMIGKLLPNSGLNSKDQSEPIEIEWVIEYDPSIRLEPPI